MDKKRAKEQIESALTDCIICHINVLSFCIILSFLNELYYHYLLYCYYSNSIAEGDSDDEDDDGDLILENDCLAPFDSQRVTNSNNTNLNRDSPSNRPHNFTVVRPLPQSLSLPNSIGTNLSDSSMMISNQNGNPTHTSSSSQESMREDGNIITL